MSIDFGIRPAPSRGAGVATASEASGMISPGGHQVSRCIADALMTRYVQRRGRDSLSFLAEYGIWIASAASLVASGIIWKIAKSRE